MGKTYRNFSPRFLLTDFNNHIQNKDEVMSNIKQNPFNSNCWIISAEKKLKKIKKIDHKHFNMKVVDGLIFGENVTDQHGDPVGNPKNKKWYKRFKSKQNRIAEKKEIVNSIE